MPRDLRIVVPVFNGSPFPTDKAPPDGLLTPNIVRSDGDWTPQLIGGIQKLVQQVYLEIVTDTLTDGIGSNLATDAINSPRDELETTIRLGVANVLQKILQYQENIELPADERLTDLQFINLEELPNNLFRANLRLTSAAGTSFVIQAPLT